MSESLFRSFVFGATLQAATAIFISLSKHFSFRFLFLSGDDNGRVSVNLLDLRVRGGCLFIWLIEKVKKVGSGVFMNLAKHFQV